MEEVGQGSADLITCANLPIDSAVQFGTCRTKCLHTYLLKNLSKPLLHSNDENFVEAFAIFCGMGITNVKMYEAAMVAMAKQQVTLEVLSYHATAPLEEAVALSR